MNLRAAYLIIAAVGEIAIAQKRINSQELTARLNSRSRRLEPYLQALVRAGIVGAEPGPRGGYFLKRPLSELTVADVLFAADPGYSMPMTPALAKQIAIAVRESLERVTLLDLITQTDEIASFSAGPPIMKRKARQSCSPKQILEMFQLGLPLNGQI
jgi:DNA-binding IscR family transcriptional regulator